MPNAPERAARRYSNERDRPPRAPQCPMRRSAQREGTSMSETTFRDDVFAGSLALVSGGTSGIGAAIGNQLARLGAHVIVTGATAPEAAAVHAATDFAAASAIVLDVRDGLAV